MLDLLVDVFDELVMQKAYKTEAFFGEYARSLSSIFPTTNKIHKLSPEKQRQILLHALVCRSFLDEAFIRFRGMFPDAASEAKHDRDTFVALCFLTQGNARLAAMAEAWFRGAATAENMEELGVDKRCSGREMIRNAIFTLRHAARLKLCFAFDQLEDTIEALKRPGQDPLEAGGSFCVLIDQLVRDLHQMPGCCIVFAFTTVVWQNFNHNLSKYISERMIEGVGAISLLPLSERAALDLVEQRMKHFIWDRYDMKPPADHPYFPFTKAEIKQARIDNRGELRQFLIFLQQRYQRLIHSKPQMELVSFTPQKLHPTTETLVQVTIQNLPEELRCLLNGTPLSVPLRIEPSLGMVEVPIAADLGDIVDVCLEDSLDHENALSLRLPREKSPKELRPLRELLDGNKFKKRREALKITQKAVYTTLGISSYNLRQLEKNLWTKAEDRNYRDYWEMLHSEPKDFLKDGLTEDDLGLEFRIEDEESSADHSQAATHRK